MKIFILSILFGFLMVGCSTNLATFSLASTGNVPISGLDKGDYVTGESCRFHLFWIPFGNSENRVTIATADALEKASRQGFHAEAMSNLSVWHTSWGILGLFGADCIKAKGQPIKLKDK